MSLIDLPTESLCTICSFLIGELFDNDRDREQAKFKRTSHRKSHQLFKRSDDQHDDYLGEFGNTRFSLNEMLSLFSLKYSCKKMYQFVHENESLWFSVVFEFPGILNYQSCVERSRFMAMSMMVPEEESSFSEHFTNALTEKFIPDMEDDIFNALNMIDVLCDRKKVVKRLCLNYSAEVFHFPNVLEKRFQYLNDPSTGDSDHTVQLFDCKVLLEYFVEAFPNVQELILLERAGKLGARPNITSSLDMSLKRWMNMKHVAVDIVFENCVQLLVAHMSSLERITLMNNQNNFGVFVDICRQLIEKGVFTSEKLISVELAGSIDSKHFHTLHALFKNFYGDHDTKYISKFRSLNVLQLSPSHEITNTDFTGLISNLVELTLVQYQSAETLDLSVFSFTSLKILNLKGCMQDLILKGMRAPVLHCMHLRMFNIPERETFDSLAHLTLDNCKGSDAEGWFAQHERLRTFKIITSNMVHEQSAEFSFRDHSHIESIHVQGAEKTEIMTCHSLRSVHLQNCNNLKLLLPHVRLSSLVLHDDDEIMSNRCVLEIDLEHCATLNMCSNNKRTFMFHQRTTVDHLIVKSMHHLDHNQFDDLLTKHTLARFIQLSSRDPLTSTDRFLLTLVPDVKSICVERKQETGSGYEIAIAETTPQYIQKLTSLTSLEHESIRNVAFHRVSGSINCENINLLILKSCTQCVISQKTFQNLRYLTISHGGVSSLSLSLQDMPLLCEINISQSHFNFKSLTRLTHMHIRSMVFQSFSLESQIHLKYLTAPNLLRLIIHRDELLLTINNGQVLFGNDNSNIILHELNCPCLLVKCIPQRVETENSFIQLPFEQRRKIQRITKRWSNDGSGSCLTM